MPDFVITAAHDEKVQCNFVVPRKPPAKPIEFSVRRMEYLDASVGEAYDAWLADRTKDSDKPGYKPPTDRELVLKNFEVCLPAAKYAQVEKLTTGEITQLFNHWMSASKVTPGESEASETS